MEEMLRTGNNEGENESLASLGYVANWDHSFF